MVDEPVVQKATIERRLSMPLPRRRFLELSAYGSLAAFLAACGASGTAAPSVAASSVAAPSVAAPSVAGSATPAGSAGAKPTIDIAMAQLSASNLLTYWSDLATAWNASGGAFQVNLNITPEADPEFTTAYRTLLAGNNPPDICTVPGGGRVIGDIVNAGLVLDLTSYSTKYGWQQRYLNGFYDGLLTNGKFYSVCYGAVPYGFIWYNKALFSQLGIVVPANRKTTQAQLIDWVGRVRGSGLEGISLGNQQAALGSHIYSMEAMRVMPKDVLAQLDNALWKEGTAKWTDPGPIKAATATQEMFKLNLWSKGVNTMAEGDALTQFAQKKSAMIYAGYWGVITIPANAPTMDFDFFQFPDLDPTIPTSIVNSAGYVNVVSAQTKHPDEVAAFLDFAISTAGQRLLFEGGYGPAVVALPSDVKLPNPHWADLLSVFAADQNLPSMFAAEAPASVVTVGEQTLQGLFNQTITPEQWCMGMQTAIDAA